MEGDVSQHPSGEMTPKAGIIPRSVTQVLKETYYKVKETYYKSKKRPNTQLKETKYTSKRDLLTWHHP